MEHAEIEKIKADYLEAYRALWGEAANRFIAYRKGWFYLTSNPLSTPYRTWEIVAITEGLRKKTEKNDLAAPPSSAP